MPSAGITVFGSQLHTHGTGRQVCGDYSIKAFKRSKAVWNFSENSSVLDVSGIPKECDSMLKDYFVGSGATLVASVWLLMSASAAVTGSEVSPCIAQGFPRLLPLQAGCQLSSTSYLTASSRHHFVLIAGFVTVSKIPPFQQSLLYVQAQSLYPHIKCL